MHPIDCHAHFFPPEMLDELRQRPEVYQARVEERDGTLWVRHDQGFGYPVPHHMVDAAGHIAEMDRQRLQRRILAPSPMLFYYWAEPEVALRVARICNDAAAGLIRRHPRRLAALASVPLPNQELTAAEMERAAGLGLCGVQIGTSVNDLPLDAPELRPFWRQTSAQGWPVMLHPYYLGPRAGLERYYLVNSIGNPVETTIAAANLLHGGIMAELPPLKVLLVHGGGFYPYQKGRLDHAWRVRQEPRVHIDQAPTTYDGGFYFDTITHDAPALRYLVDAVGAERVLLGTDFPFDMGVDDPLAAVAAAELPAGVQKAILETNAARVFGLDSGR